MSWSRCLLPLFAASLGLASVAGGALPNVKLLETRALPGGLVVVVAEGRAEGNLRAKLGDRLHPFFPHPADPGHRAVALVPLPFDLVAGSQVLEIEAEGAPSRHLPFVVAKAAYPTIAVTIAPGIAHPSEADLARAKREREEILKIYAEPTGERLWSEPFRYPVKSKLTCGFGVKRTFNGSVQSVHRGLDLRAPQGTPIHAAAPGIVRLAKELFYGGNLVLLDHGFGLFTAYAHLSRIDVKVGQRVQPGERLGLSGATGRVSAAHLHWGTTVAGMDVNPLELLRWTASLTSGSSGVPKPVVARTAKKRH